MRGIVDKFGECAGRIWSVLDERGCLCKDELLSLSGLNDLEFFAGLGWLAREGKVVVDGENLCLCEGICDTVIGFYAGRVWRVLDVWGVADFISIKRLSGLSDSDIESALGWLAREDKIIVKNNGKFTLK